MHCLSGWLVAKAAKVLQVAAQVWPLPLHEWQKQRSVTLLAGLKQSPAVQGHIHIAWRSAGWPGLGGAQVLHMSVQVRAHLPFCSLMHAIQRKTACQKHTCSMARLRVARSWGLSEPCT